MTTEGEVEIVETGPDKPNMLYLVAMLLIAFMAVMLSVSPAKKNSGAEVAAAKEMAKITPAAGPAVSATVPTAPQAAPVAQTQEAPQAAPLAEKPATIQAAPAAAAGPLAEPK